MAASKGRSDEQPSLPRVHLPEEDTELKVLSCASTQSLSGSIDQLPGRIDDVLEDEALSLEEIQAGYAI